MEREPAKAPITPPEWWHNAIRSNLPGFQINPQRFESVNMSTENGIRFVISSVLAGDPEGHPEGIYISALVPPWGSKRDIEPFLSTVDVIKKLIVEESEKIDPQSCRKVPSEVNETLNKWGVIINTKASIGVAFLESGRDDYVFLALAPVAEEEVMKNYLAPEHSKGVEEDLLGRYFYAMTYFDRIKLLCKDNISQELRLSLLNIEMRIGKGAVLQLSMRLSRMEEERSDVDTQSPEVQEEYRLLLNQILSISGESEELAVLGEFTRLGIKKTIGWFKFYEKYWSEKLGIEFTDFPF